MDREAIDYWKRRTEEQRLLDYWRAVSQVEGRIDRAYFSSGPGAALLSELSEKDKRRVIDILVDIQVPRSHLEGLTKIRTKRHSWEYMGSAFTGCYEHTEGLIYVDSSWPDHIFRATLVHELGHHQDHAFFEKLQLNRKRSGETIADFYEVWWNGSPKEKETIKKFLGI